MSKAGGNPVQDLMVAMGALAEMAHSFHVQMINAGASEKEAASATSGFIAAFWHEAMEDNRRKKMMEGQDDGEA